MNNTGNNIRFIAVDVETSGMSVQQGGRVIEVGAVLIENGIIVDGIDTMISTGTPIHSAAERVHGISAEMLHGKPLPEYAWNRFCEFVGNTPLIAHNAPFDSAFIRNELRLLDIGLPNQWHCTVRLARKKLPQLPNHKLDTVYRYLFGTLPPAIQRHRAMDDARLAARIWIELNGKH